MKILVVVLAMALAVCIVACAPDASAGVGKENTITRVEPVEGKSFHFAVQCGGNGDILLSNA